MDTIMKIKKETLRPLWTTLLLCGLMVAPVVAVDEQKKHSEIFEEEYVVDTSNIGALIKDMKMDLCANTFFKKDPWYPMKKVFIEDVQKESTFAKRQIIPGLASLVGLAPLLLSLLVLSDMQQPEVWRALPDGIATFLTVAGMIGSAVLPHIFYHGMKELFKKGDLITITKKFFNEWETTYAQMTAPELRTTMTKLHAIWKEKKETSKIDTLKFIRKVTPYFENLRTFIVNEKLRKKSLLGKITPWINPNWYLTPSITAAVGIIAGLVLLHKLKLKISTLSFG